MSTMSMSMSHRAGVWEGREAVECLIELKEEHIDVVWDGTGQGRQ